MLAVNRHRTLAPLAGKAPSLGDGAFVAPSAAVIGDVKIGAQASVFYGSVIRGGWGDGSSEVAAVRCASIFRCIVAGCFSVEQKAQSCVS